MKRVLTIFLLFFSIGCFGQEIGLKNVRKQIRPIVKSIWNISDNSTIFVVRDVDNCVVGDEDFIPEQYFAIYRLGWLSPHSPRLYLIVRRNRGYILNMKRSLSDIIVDVLSVTKRFSLSDEELILTMQTICEGYVRNTNNNGGTKILKGPMKKVDSEPYLWPYGGTTIVNYP